MNDEEKEKVKDIIDDINKDVKLPPYDNKSGGGYTREYKEYKEAESSKRSKTRYERFCIWAAGLISVRASEDMHEKLSSPLRLLKWDITPGMVLSGSLVVGLASLFIWATAFILNVFLNFIPLFILVLMMILMVALPTYFYYKPIMEARTKVVRSSEDMILSILYMVIYLRSSPNLEGAVRFAALNLDGPIADDLKSILWDLEVGNYDRIDNAIEDYMKVWKDYNKDYLEALELIKTSINEPNPERRENMLEESIDTILDGTREKMKHYSQSLKVPVMILNAMGAMLPVLVMILLPMVSLFMGELIKPWHLFLSFNILLPVFLYWFMQRVLSSRPPTVTFQASSEDLMPPRGRIKKKIFGYERSIPVWPIGLAVFLLVASYGIFGYLSFPVMFPAEGEFANAPGIFVGENGMNSLAMLLRGVSITTGLGLAIGISFILGNLDRKVFEDSIRNIEGQLPTALFELGNSISGGKPMEVALKDASQATSDLEISSLFEKASANVERMGMNFEDSFFDDQYGALKDFPSEMINTVMEAIIESSEKGSQTASMAMITISRYLENIHKTNEKLKDLMEETTTTIRMLSYLLAPIISAVAVGMSQTIIGAMFKLSSAFQESLGGSGGLPSGELAGGAGGGFGGVLGNVKVAISPEILQFVVGLYLIQLLWILGTFYVKITHGNDKTIQRIFVGKAIISGVIIYTVVLLIISVMFGGMVSEINI